MPTPSNYRLSLGPKILFRARLILGSLLALVTFFVVGGIYQGIQSGDFDKIFVKPFRDFGSEFEKAVNATPEPLPSLTTVLSSPSPIPAPIKTAAPKQQVQKTQPVAQNCIRKNIREGEFASNKCYSQQDLEDLNYYLQRFDGAVFNKTSAEGTIGITCNCRVQQECDFFKNSCDEAKQKKSQAESDINKYRGIVQGIIARGQ